MGYRFDFCYFLLKVVQYNQSVIICITLKKIILSLTMLEVVDSL